MFGFPRSPPSPGKSDLLDGWPINVFAHQVDFCIPKGLFEDHSVFDSCSSSKRSYFAPTRVNVICHPLFPVPSSIFVNVPCSQVTVPSSRLFSGECSLFPAVFRPMFLVPGYMFPVPVFIFGCFELNWISFQMNLVQWKSNMENKYTLSWRTHLMKTTGQQDKLNTQGFH